MAKYKFYPKSCILVNNKNNLHYYTAYPDKKSLDELNLLGWSNRALDKSELQTMASETPVEFDTTEEYEMLCLLMV